jgi:hypothetical protein
MNYIVLYNKATKGQLMQNYQGYETDNHLKELVIHVADSETPYFKPWAIISPKPLSWSF